MSAANDAWETVGLSVPVEGPPVFECWGGGGGQLAPVDVGQAGGGEAPAPLRRVRCEVVDSCRMDPQCPGYDACRPAEADAAPVLPGVAWGRFSWPLISDFMARLDQAGYIRGSAAEVGQAVILLADAAIAYEGGRPVAEARPAAAAVADVQTPRQVRMRFRVSASTVTRWRLAGELSPYLELPSGQFRYFGAVVDQLAAKLARR
jgi:hypothetical protein